ncbi:MAG: hypothetical protein KH706_01370 [Faecalibacterium prausnitzii]|nr:hypothetical protein [Faecalibacterium prausnitzii]
MLLRTITLANSGNVCLDGGGYILALGYECNRGIYQLQLRPTGEWDGLTIRACWHLPDGTSTTTLAVDGCMDVPAAVTALPGTGCITFEGAAEGKTITSSDLRYLVGDNSGVEDRTMPEPDTPAWEQLVGTVAESTAQAEEAADRADKAAAAAEGALTAVKDTASKALTDITHTGAAQTQAVTRAGEQAVQEVDAAAQAGVGSVEQTVQTAATAAIQRVEQTGSTQVQAVANAGAGQVKKIEDAAAKKLEGITQLAGQAEDSATKAEQAAQRAEDAATAASAIIDDTAITPAKTWSSLHILETLCPPIQATGNPVVCHPVEGYPLGVSVDFAPIQEGAGDPSPENIRPIKARESVDVTRCGANLLNITPFAPIERNGIKFEYVASGGIRITGTADKLTDSPVWPLALPPGMYKMSTYENLSHQIVVTRGGKKVYLSANSPVEILRGDAVKYYYFLVNEGKPVATTIFPSLSISTVPLETAPYTGQTATLTLPTPCYGGKLDAVTGEGQETWAVLELTGGERYILREKFSLIEISLVLPQKVPTHKVVCSHWAGQKAANATALYAENQNINVGITTCGYSTAEELKEYVAAQYTAGTPVTVAYIKATPTPITATGGKPIPALAGTNTLLTDGDSLTVTGRTDPTHEMQQLRAAVVALGGTI